MRPRALIVEDEHATRDALCSIVEGEGFDVDAVDTAERALDLLHKGHYATVLLDIVLPKMSGAALMEHLHTHSPSVLESIVVVTGLDVAEIRKLYPTVPEALGKPVLPARLRKAVRRFLPESDASTGISVA